MLEYKHHTFTQYIHLVHPQEVSADRAEAGAEIEIDAGVAGAGLGMRDAEGRLADEAKDPPDCCHVQLDPKENWLRFRYRQRYHHSHGLSHIPRIQ